MPSEEPVAADDESTVEIFDDSASWRTEVVIERRLQGDDRFAGASTSAAMPQLAEHLAEMIAPAPRMVGLDVGGGLGSVSAWLAERTGHRFVPLDPSGPSCAAARRLFGLAAVQAEASALPVESGAIDVVILNGVVSLLDDLAGAVHEAVRVVAPGGLVTVADLTAAGEQHVVSGANVFWTTDQIVRRLESAGCTVEYAACSAPGAGAWASVQSVVNDEIARRFADRPGFARWREDGRHLQRHVEAGTVVACSVIARVSA